jgi:hypothetical protein
MTSPTPPPESPEPDEAPTAESAPVLDAATPATAGPQAGPPQQQLPPQPGPYPPYVPPYAYQPFVPKLREPWVNPAKRGVLAAVSIAVAIVLLAGGFVIGAAVGHHRDRGVAVVRMGPAGRIGYGMPAPRPRFGYRYRGPAGVPGRILGRPAVPPRAPAPAAPSSSSHR